MKDDAIVALFRARDEEAIARAKKEYEKYCIYIAQNLLDDIRDSEECVNDVMLAAWNSIPPNEPSSLKTYLGKLTREYAVDRLRKKHALKRLADESASPLEELEEMIGGGSVDEEIQAKELTRLINSFLYSLREDERNVFIRRYWYYDSVKAICSRYGYGHSKVLVTLKRTRDKLAAYLKKEGYMI